MQKKQNKRKQKKLQKIKLILGLDIDSSKIGYSVISGKTGELIDCGKIQSKLRYVARTFDLYDQLIAVINEYDNDSNYNISFVVIEDYGHYPNQRLAVSKGELIGMVKKYLFDHNINYLKWLSVTTKGRKRKMTFKTECMCNPTQLKKFIFGKGNASSKGKASQLMLKVYQQSGVEFSSDDEADSYMLANMGRIYLMMKFDIFILNLYSTQKSDGGIMVWNLQEKNVEPIKKWLKNSVYDNKS